MKKLIGFDLDGTLTQHRTPIPEAVRTLLDDLGRRYRLVMVGAGNCPRIFAQMGNYPIDIVGNYGMQEATVENGALRIVRQDTCPADRERFLREAARLRQQYGYTEYAGDSVEFHESGMVTFALLGTKADLADKLAFDPDRSKRRVMYAEVCRTFPDYVVYIGGSSSFDLAPARYNKYDAMCAYGASRGIGVEEMIFVGDDFDDGGGDSHIRLRGMDYVRIEDYRTAPETLRHIFL
jgi:hydroxymethylpyrimidine pyrophosphatase-like HAD family hydrolase